MNTTRHSVPPNQEDASTLALLRNSARAAGALALVISSLVLAGWTLDLEFLTRILSGAATMMPWAAVGFILAGAVLLTLAHPRFGPRARPWTIAFAGLIALLGAATVFEYVAPAELGFDDLLFTSRTHAAGDLHPGRMAPATAMAFALLGTGLLLRQFPGHLCVLHQIIHVRQRREPRQQPGPKRWAVRLHLRGEPAGGLGIGFGRHGRQPNQNSKVFVQTNCRGCAERRARSWAALAGFGMTHTSDLSRRFRMLSWVDQVMWSSAPGSLRR